MFVCICVDSLRPSQRFSHVRTDLSGFDQYLAEDRVSCSMTQRNATAKSVIASPL